MYSYSYQYIIIEFRPYCMEYHYKYNDIIVSHEVPGTAVPGTVAQQPKLLRRRGDHAPFEQYCSPSLAECSSGDISVAAATTCRRFSQPGPGWDGSLQCGQCRAVHCAL